MSDFSNLCFSTEVKSVLHPSINYLKSTEEKRSDLQVLSQELFRGVGVVFCFLRLTASISKI